MDMYVGHREYDFSESYVHFNKLVVGWAWWPLSSRRRERPPQGRLLLQRDSDVGAERLALPLVAGALVQTDPHRVGAALAGVERAERQVAGQGRRRNLDLVAIDADEQLRRVGHAEIDSDVGERLADHDIRRD